MLSAVGEHQLAVGWPHAVHLADEQAFGGDLHDTRIVYAQRTRLVLHRDELPINTDQVVGSSDKSRALGAQRRRAHLAVIGGEDGCAGQPLAGMLLFFLEHMF